MKKLVRIKATGYNSHFGYVVEERNGAALIKVPCKTDWMDWIECPNCIVLGKSNYHEIKKAASD